MIEIVKQKMILIAEITHRRIFGHEMSGEMRNFLGHLSWSFSGGIIASAIMMVVNIFVGRLIGPEGYGKYALVLSISQVLMIAIVFGFDISGVWSVARSKNKEEVSKNISSAFYFVLLALIIFSFVFLSGNSWISSYFHVSRNLLFAVFILTIAFSLKSISDALIRGLHYFKTQFIARQIEVSAIVLFFSFFFFYLKDASFFYYIVALSLGASFLVILYFRKLYQYLGRFDFNAFKSQFSYGKIILAGSVLGIIFDFLGKFIIAKYLSLAQLGVYSAYFMASTNLIAQGTQMFVNVFLPSASKIEDKSFVSKMNKIYRLIFIPGFLVVSSMIFIIIKLFGKAYGINWVYIFSFGFLATLQIILTINTTAITAISKSLYRKYIIRLNILNLGYIVAYGLLIYLHQVSLLVIIAILILNVLANIYIQRGLIQSYFKKSELKYN